MGFQLGRALGKLAGSAIRSATHGLVRPSFNKPSIAPTFSPDSTVTTRGFFPWMTRTTSYGGGQAISSYPVGGGGTNGGGGGGGGAPGTSCPSVWDGTRFRAMRLNKSTYVTRGGGTSRWPQSLVVHPKGTECVPRRRMNPGNGRAAIHAVRRLVAFYGLSQRVAKQLRKAASKAHIRGVRHGQRRLPPGRNVEVVNVE